MAFEIDVLIIFADRDDEPVQHAEVGWVMQFKNFLEVMLTEVMGAKPNILLKGEHDTMTAPKLDNVGVLLSILSKDFVRSAPCLEHLETFAQRVTSAPESAKRIFKVFKGPVATPEQPERLRELFGYGMYQLDPDTGELLEYTDYFSHDAERQYWMEIVDLSYDIHESLEILRKGSTPAEVKTIFRHKSIYLAETAHDLSVQRNIIARELQRLGYSVLPKHTLPGAVVELEKIVTDHLSTCMMSIHLIGNAYGEVPTGGDRSLLEIQNKIAADRSVRAKEKEENFSRLIWISPNLNSANERQKKFVEMLKRDFEAKEGTEILQTLLEDFKNIVREELEEAGEKKILDETGGRAIYLMHDRADRNAVKPFVDVIESAGFSVLMPSFDGELLELRQKHIENLRNLDGAIIFKGNVNDQWVRMKAMDLLKAPGFGRKKPIFGKAVVGASGPIKNKEPFQNLDLRVIDGDEQDSLKSLRSFLQELRP